MVEGLTNFGSALYIVTRPPLAEFGAAESQGLYQFCEPGIAQKAPTACAKAGQYMLCEAFPIDQELTIGRRGKCAPDDVAFTPGHLTIIAEDYTGSFVPCHNIPTLPGDIGRAGAEMIEKVL